jgi:hypothetical protein
MKLLIGLLFTFTSICCFGQSIQKELDASKIIELKVEPIGDRFAEASWAHSYKLFKSDSNYVVILNEDDGKFKRVLSKNELEIFLDYIKKWRSKKPKHHGLSQDAIVLKIDEEIETFNASFKSDVHISDFMHKGMSSSPTRLGN